MQRFRADALVPIRFGHPIAAEGLSLAGGEIALARRTVADGPDGFSRRVEFDGPVGVVVEYRADDLQAFLHALVGDEAHVGAD